MRELPLVSALVAAYNAEPYIEEALRSALDQDWPAAKLEIVVVDDGSTDGTAAVVERLQGEHPGRITLIRQENRGACGAVNTAHAAARGDVLALLDADDAWPRRKLKVQTAVLAKRPEVGMVYGDMRVVDAQGRVLHETFIDEAPPQGDCLAEVLFSNDCTASSVIWRAALSAPIPDGVPYTDWWFAAHVAGQAELAYVPKPRTLYRFHGGNLTLGTEGAARLRELRKAIALRTWFLRRVELDARGHATVWRAIELNEAELDAPLEPHDREWAAELRAEGEALLRRGEAAGAAAVLSKAAAYDLTAPRESLHAALAAAPGGEAIPGQTPLRGAADRVILAYADELLDAPELLDRYVSEMGGVRGVTLALDATAISEEDLGALAQRVPDDLDVLAVLGPLDAIGQARLAAGAHGLLSERPCELSLPRV